jgi:hypothetical protein
MDNYELFSPKEVLADVAVPTFTFWGGMLYLGALSQSFVTGLLFIAIGALMAAVAVMLFQALPLAKFVRKSFEGEGTSLASVYGYFLTRCAINVGITAFVLHVTWSYFHL